MCPVRARAQSPGLEAWDIGIEWNCGLKGRANRPLTPRLLATLQAANVELVGPRPKGLGFALLAFQAKGIGLPLSRFRKKG